VCSEYKDKKGNEYILLLIFNKYLKILIIHYLSMKTASLAVISLLLAGAVRATNFHNILRVEANEIPEENDIHLEQKKGSGGSGSTTTTTSKSLGPIYPYIGNYFGASIHVGSANVSTLVTIDPESPTTIITYSNKSGSGYSPLYSTAATQNDVFRYKDGSLNNYGYYFNDQICVNNLTACFKQDIFAAQFYTEKYQPFSGVVGLGLGSPKFGNSFLNNLYNSTNGAY
jgi:hypothetical protein